MADLRVGIDVGGTFTDGVMVRDGRIAIAKVRSRPDDIPAAILDCVDALGVELDAVDVLIHGSTVATNAVIEKSAPPFAHITTAGHRDILFIRRGDSQPFDTRWEPPTPIVARRHIFEVRERRAWDGAVLEPLDEAQARRVAELVLARGYRSASVTFLHAYADGGHERRMREILHEVVPGIDVSISSEVLPHYREFERSSTTAVNAALVPLVSTYLDALEARARERGLRRPVLVMQSNGGLATAAEAKRLPARMVRSGPAGGAVATHGMAAQLGIEDAIFLDMGGTSTEVAVLSGGEMRWTPEVEFAWGVPIRFPSVDIHSIGAGGGSIAHVEAGRYLKVGPRSAGADPGPACYDRGGEAPTTTDAQVVLGRLDPDALLGGRMPISRERAVRALDEHVATPLGQTLERAALGVIDVTTSNTVQAVRLMTVHRGLDPRRSQLLASGGSGPLYAADVARALGVETVVVSPYGAVACALGMVLADFQYDASATLLVREDELDLSAVEATFARFGDELARRLEDAGVPPQARAIERLLELRYDGQGYELPVPVDGSLDGARFAQVVAAFHAAHERAFGWSDAERLVEVVFARAVARGAMPGKPSLAVAPEPARADAGPRAARTRACWFSGHDEPLETPVLARELLAPGDRLAGPAIVEQPETTTLVPPGWRLRVDAHANLLLTLADGGEDREEAHDR